MRTQLPVILVSITALLGCKPVASNDSEVASLDNFAGGNTVNVCTGNYALAASAEAAIDPKASLVHREKIRASLSAIPTELQAAFFEVLNGKILLSKNIATDCNASNAAACVGANGDKSFAIYIREEGSEAATSQNIQHELVRSFGYVVSEIMLRIQNTPSGSVQVENTNLTAMKRELAERLLADVAGNQKYKLDAFSGKLDASVLSSSLSDEERRSAYEKIAGSAQAKTFADAVYGELFDSAYCSTETRTVLAADFPSTNQLVEDFKAELLLAINSATQEGVSAGNSLGLFGRWGRGNGPMRQGLRNWGGFRRSGGGVFNVRRFRSGGGFIGQNRIFGGRFSRY